MPKGIPDFPNKGHSVLLQKADPSVQYTYSLDDIITGKVDLVDGPLARCHCGEDVPIPGGGVKQMAKNLAATLPKDTKVVFGVLHHTDTSISKETHLDLLKKWLDANKGGYGSERDTRLRPNEDKK